MADYIYATKLHLYLIAASNVFVAALLGYLYFAEGLPLFVPATVIPFMLLLLGVMWASYRGKLPLMRVEGR